MDRRAKASSFGQRRSRCRAGSFTEAGMKFRTFAIALSLSVSIAAQAYSGQWIEGRVTHVRDVDTVEVNRLPVRLEGVDGPELDERGGQNAKRWMQQLVLRKPVRCWLTGRKNRDRWIGVCYLGEDDIGALAIAAGQARDCPRYSGGRYAKYETKRSRAHRQHGYCK